MEDEDIAPNSKYIQLIQSVWAESRACSYNTGIKCPAATFCPYLLDQLYMYLAQFLRLPFCGLISIQFLHLCILHRYLCRLAFM